jgi:protein phosphatase
VRITHDHSYVEELVDAGEITADEARLHPSRSIITRALGSDPDMYADHFTLEVSEGDRIVICSDGLSSMVSDKGIEEIAVSTVTPQAAADTLVSAALTAGGHDNVTVIVVDVVDDGLAVVNRTVRNRNIRTWIIIAIAALAVLCGVFTGIIRNSWYVGINASDYTVAIYRGASDVPLGQYLNQMVETTSVEVADLPAAVRKQLEDGITVMSEGEARATVERYRDQIKEDKDRQAEAAQAAQSNESLKQVTDSPDPANTESGDAIPLEARTTAQQTADRAEADAAAGASSAAAGKAGE